MVDDLRNHDALPSPEERAWMEQDAVALVMKSVALAFVAIAIGVSVSVALDQVIAPAAVASAAPR